MTMTLSLDDIPKFPGKEPGTLIHLGAGRCRELDSWLEFGFEEIVLVEADPVRAADLSRACRDYSKVRVLPQAISSHDRAGELQVLSYPDASSLRQPTGLLELLPGIYRVKAVPCSVRGVNSLISELNLDPGMTNGMVIEAPGEEYEIVRALVEGDHLNLLSFLVVQAPTIPLYDGSETIGAIEDLLIKSQFLPERSAPKSQDPVRAVRVFRRDTAALEIEKLKAQLLEANDQKQASAEQLSAAQNTISQLQKQIAELETLRERSKELEKERDLTQSKRSAADEAARAAEKQAEDLLQQVEQSRKEQALSEQEAKEAQAALSSKSKRVEELEAQLLEANDQKQDSAEQLSAAQNTISQLQRQVAELETLRERSKELEKERDLIQSKFAATDEAARTAEKQAEMLQQQLEKAKNDITRLQSELQSRPAIANELKSLLAAQAAQIEEQIEKGVQKGVQAQQEAAELLEKNLLNPILTHMNSSARQVESYIGLSAFLESGTLAPDLHGWPVSPDLALYLMRLISSREYELIIEFGSGSSTVLMARAVAQKLARSQLSTTGEKQLRIADSSDSPQRDVAGSQSPVSVNVLARELARTDILPPIVAFEHKREYYEKTLADLKEQGLVDFVELVYAPLRDYQAPSGDTYLFYSCAEVLESLSNRLSGGASRVLAFIDGPPAATGKHARYPALPLLLDKMTGVHFDILIDDYIRKEEKEIVEMWSKELDRRGYQKTRTILPFEKGAVLFEAL